MASSNGTTPRWSNTTGGVALMANPGYLHIVTLVGGSGALAHLEIYDSATTNAGDPIATLAVPTGGYSFAVNFGGMAFNKGLWAVLTGAGSSVLVTVA